MTTAPDVPSPSPLNDRAAEIFERALALDANERAAFLERACDDASLRSELQSLLRAHDAAMSFLGDRQQPESLDGFTSVASPQKLGAMPDDIDRYRLHESIGEGGFGAVYRAEQLEPVRRAVAVKVIKLGMDTRQVIARFEAERQALAMMDHPAIAKVLDAGATRSGRPYFAMELVAGEPITRFCDAERLDTRQRLELFVQVCSAIQHAHQKGIIHRDIKPSNVLVSMQDGAPMPKVIDFGIAKATEAELTTQTIFTEQRQMVGTPAYMSPEQAGSAGADIDTRSDIYSLGVLLYELLTGVTPFDTHRLLRAGLDELVRIIREEEPPRPSTRLSTLGEAETDVAERRDTDVRRLRMSLRGDLDWIVMKCLEKDRSRRYPTASALADDVQRFLHDEPVVARPPSVRYQLHKLVRRHRGAVTAGAAIAFVLAGAAAVSITFAVRAAEQRRRADREAADARAIQALAEKRAEETKQVAEFQANMLSTLDAEAVGRGIRTHLRGTLKDALERQAVGEWPNRRLRTLSEIEDEVSKLDAALDPVPATDVARRVLDEFLLGQASKTVEQSFADQPLVQARIRDSLSAAYTALGLQGQAEEQCRLALAVRRRELAPDHPETAENLTVLSFIVQDIGRYAEAEALCREALSIRRGIHPEKHVDVASSMQNLAVTLRRQGKLAEAEQHYRQALAIRRELLGNDNLDTAGSLNSLALLLQNKGDYAGAEPLFRESLDIRRRLLGDRHVIVAGSLNNLANLLAARGNRTEAEALLREALEMRRGLLGSEHPDVAQSLHNLGLFLNHDGRFADAEPLLREAVAIWRKTLPRGHPDMGRGLVGLAVVVKAQRKYAEAEPLYQEALDIARQALPQGDPAISSALAGLASVLCDKGNYQHAEPLYREIIASHEQRLPPEQRQLPRLGLADTLIRRAAAGQDTPAALMEILAEAETLLLEADRAFSASPNPPPTPILVRRCLESLVKLYELRHLIEPDMGFDVNAAEWRARLEQQPAAPQ